MSGVHLQVFAIREVVHEFLGFSPAELVWPLCTWTTEVVAGGMARRKKKENNLLEYACRFRERLHPVCEIDGENLQCEQTEMKSWYNRDAKNIVFRPGKKVLVLLLLRFRDYIVATPDRRRRHRLPF